VNSHLRLVAKIARGHRGYGLPISELISEGNVGLMQAIKRFEPDKGFRLATYATWWIKAAIQEYILRSWSLVKMSTTVNQKKLFFNLRKAKNKITVLDEGDMRPDEVKIIARQLGVTQTDVIHMNRRLGGGDASLNAPIGRGGGTPGPTPGPGGTEIRANGRPGGSTSMRPGRRHSPRARSSRTAARRSPRRSPRSTTGSDASSRRVGSPKNRSRSAS